MVMRLEGLRTKNDCAGEFQQQFTRADFSEVTADELVKLCLIVREVTYVHTCMHTYIRGHTVLQTRFRMQICIFIQCAYTHVHNYMGLHTFLYICITEILENIIYCEFLSEPTR
jgi:hypothetical protein